MSTTLAKIAQHAGVAKSTVSMTLSNNAAAQRFSAQTRQRIIEVANELGYRPNFFATSLAGAKSPLLMFGLTHLADAWASAVASGFEEEAARRQYRMLIMGFHDKEDPVTFSRAILGPHGIGAMAVVGGARTKFTDEAVRQLADEGVVIVTINRPVDHPKVSEILIDNQGGGRMAAEHLYDRGVERLWIVTHGPRSANLNNFDRVKGALAVATERGKPRPRLIEAGDETGGIESARQAMAAALESGTPDGVFGVSGMYAVGACHALLKGGHVIGRDVPVVSFDSGNYSDCHYPPLTAVSQPCAEMGRIAAQMLVEAISDPGQLGRRVNVDATMVIRESSNRATI